MVIDNLLLRYSVTPGSISHFREMLLQVYFPKFVDIPSYKAIEKAGEILHEMIYLHSYLDLQVNADFEIWQVAKWLVRERSIHYSFVARVGEGSSDYKTRALASNLGDAIYTYCKNTYPLDDITQRTLERMFEGEEWQRG